MKNIINSKIWGNLCALGFLTLCGSIVVSVLSVLLLLGYFIGIPITLMAGAIALFMAIGVFFIK